MKGLYRPRNTIFRLNAPAERSYAVTHARIAGSTAHRCSQSLGR